jgi:hypothetical protein
MLRQIAQGNSAAVKSSSVFSLARSPNLTVIVDETVNDGNAGNDEETEQHHLKPLRQALEPLLRDDIERHESPDDARNCEDRACNVAK